MAAILVLVVARPAPAAPAPALRNLAAIQINAVVQNTTAVQMPVPQPARRVIVRAGQTVETIAATYGGDPSSIRWANQLGSGDQPDSGTALLIPPTPGALVKALPGETPTSFAARLHMDPAIILDYNSLTSNAPLRAGRYLQVPRAAAPRGSLISTYFAVLDGGIPAVPAQRVPEDTFPYGQCTYYVATRRSITWAGNAIDWWWAASGHRPEGQVPVQGAIVVFRIGWMGHVAYVEHVNTDGSFVISEMNYFGTGGGWGRVDRRTIAVNDWTVVGFIY